ncbi:MAG TPA: hypothetical protein VF767_03790, partial [Bryobacteraceae bacterium]
MTEAPPSPQAVCTKAEAPSEDIRLFVVLFALAALTRIALCWWVWTHLESRRIEIHQLAISVAEGRGYGNPYVEPTGPTAHVAPGYPLLLAALYSLFGTGRDGDLAELALGALTMSVLYALLPLVARALGFSERTGIVAAAIGIAVPYNFVLELRGGDASAAALCLASLALITARLWRSGRFTASAGARHGLVWGAGLLIAPALLPVEAAWLATAALRHGRQVLRYGSVLAFTTLAVLSPWAIRNAAVLGSPILFRSNLGLELQVSHNDLARPTMLENLRNGDFTKHHPFNSRAEAQRVRDLGEVAYNRGKLRQAVQWMMANPVGTVRLTALRILLFWFPLTDRPAQVALIWALTIVGIAGWVLALRNRIAGMPLLAAIWLTYPLMYYAV